MHRESAMGQASYTPIAVGAPLALLVTYLLMPSGFPFPPISVLQAHLLAAFFTFSYVGSLYISKQARLRFSTKQVEPQNGQPRAREDEERWRDDPGVIQARLFAASLSTFVDCLAISLLFWKFDGGRKSVGYHHLIPCYDPHSITVPTHSRLPFWNFDSSRFHLIYGPCRGTPPMSDRASTIPWPFIRAISI